MFVLPLYKRTKAVCLLKIVPRKFSLKSLKINVDIYSDKRNKKVNVLIGV